MRTHFPGLLCVGRDATDLHIAKVSDFFEFKSILPFNGGDLFEHELIPLPVTVSCTYTPAKEAFADYPRDQNA